MSKKKSLMNATAEVTMPRKRKNGTGVTISKNFEIDSELWAAVEEFMASPSHEFRPGKKETVENALKLYLKEKGFWPPKPKKE